MGRRLIAVFTDNWALKLAAVALALLLWLAVRASTPGRQTFSEIPVEVDVRDPDWRLEGEPQPSIVSITVAGPTSQLLALARNPPRIVLPVDQVNDSTERQVVPPQWIQIPRGLDQIRVVSGPRPDTIRLRYERLASRTLPVRVRTRGDLPEGFALALPISSNPSTVELRGPAREIDALDSVPLLPVDLSGIRSTTNVPTRVDTTAFEGLRVSPREINVILRVLPVDSQAPVLELSPPRRRGSGGIR